MNQTLFAFHVAKGLVQLRNSYHLRVLSMTRNSAGPHGPAGCTAESHSSMFGSGGEDYHRSLWEGEYDQWRALSAVGNAIRDGDDRNGEGPFSIKSSDVHPIMAPISVDLVGFSFSSLLSSAFSGCCSWRSASTSPVRSALLIIFGLKENAPFGTNVDAKTITPITVNCEAKRESQATEGENI